MVVDINVFNKMECWISNVIHVVFPIPPFLETQSSPMHVNNQAYYICNHPNIIVSHSHHASLYEPQD